MLVVIAKNAHTTKKKRRVEMKKYVYVVNIRRNYHDEFNSVRLFYNKQDAIDYLESKGFIHDFDDVYILDNASIPASAAIGLHEVRGEVKWKKDIDGIFIKCTLYYKVWQ